MPDKFRLRYNTSAALAARLAAAEAGAVPDATTSVKGRVELATNAEAVAGVDTTRAVTPSGLAAGLATVGGAPPDASTTVKGIVELATNAETTTGTDAVRATTPAGVAAAIAAIPAVPAATDSVAGKTRYATSAETAAYTVPDAAVTPAALFQSDLNLYNNTMAAVAAAYQPKDPDLDALAALTTASYGRNLNTLTNQAGLMALLQAASTTVSGIVELATNAEAAAGTDTVRAVTPAALLNAMQVFARRAVNAQTGTTYTLAATDETKIVQHSNAAAITVTVPENTVVPIPTGFEVEYVRLGAGTVTFSPAVGVTINSRSSLLSINGQYGSVKLRKRAANTWILTGDLV